jgi:hypothetical protein
MRRIVLALLLCLAAPLAFAGKPTDAQIDRLLAATRARSLVEGMLAQIETTQKQALDAAFAGQKVTPEQRAKADRLMAQLVQRIREGMAWEKLLPMYHRIYANSLDSADVDAMIAFYETPAGQRLIERMPAVMQQSMSEVQGLLMPILNEWEKDFQAEFAATPATEAPDAQLPEDTY